ncbi:serine/threonine-protein kinase HT1-like protein [Corchorus olitorius]|uniref:Serine/threonine-protein kinase HT1-like protein n=1 Tax=Corchorus olitorius TaxID=93759 RepID=A0A1R3K9J2_9ROSI|nr:serine/threonine-protein kinase HT1-like protein [Corchorus olitorius]
MDPKVLAEKLARQNAHRAGLTASSVPPPLSGSRLGESSAQGDGACLLQDD